jgi:hypothetical protein
VPPLYMADVICKCLPYTVVAPSNATALASMQDAAIRMFRQRHMLFYSVN